MLKPRTPPHVGAYIYVGGIVPLAKLKGTER